jgi:hypothetical protein
MLNNQGRPTTTNAANTIAQHTFSVSKALVIKAFTAFFVSLIVPAAAQTVIPQGLRTSDKIEITKDHWKRSAGGALGVYSATVKNKTNTGLKDIRIMCMFFGASGTVINSKTETVFEIFPANASRQISGINFGYVDSQAKTTDCRIVDAKTVQ